MMTTETLDRSIAAFARRSAPPTDSQHRPRSEATSTCRAPAALRNLNGCGTRLVRDGRDVEPPAVFTDTLRRGERGELTTDELRMLDEIRSGDYRVTNEPARRAPGPMTRSAR